MQKTKETTKNLIGFFLLQNLGLLRAFSLPEKKITYDPNCL